MEQKYSLFDRDFIIAYNDYICSSGLERSVIFLFSFISPCFMFLLSISFHGKLFELFDDYKMMQSSFVYKTFYIQIQS